jgi:hypothetical protein
MKTSLVGLVALLGGGALAYGCGGSGNGNGADAGGDAATDTNVTQPDRTTHDAGHDAGHDSGLPNPFEDTGAPESGAGSCPIPTNIGEWTPPAYVEPAQVPGACLSSDYSAYYTACLSGAPMSTCTAFTSSHAACAACLLTPLTNSTWGPLYTNDGVTHINVPGCLDLTDPGDHACAKTLEEQAQCETAACDTVCPVTDSASFTNWQACISAADMEECSTYAKAGTACVMGITSSAAAPCLTASTFQAYFLAVAPIFCGGPEGGTPEGGTDAKAESSTDATTDAVGADVGADVGPDVVVDAIADAPKG